MENEAQQQGAVAVNRVAVRLPAFFTDVATWFVQVEASFAVAGVNQEQTRYFHLLTALPPRVLTQIQDKLTHEGPTPYTTIKAVIVARNTPTTTQSVDALFQKRELGDQKPSERLRELQAQLLRVNPNTDVERDAVLKHTFMKVLPVGCQQILAGHVGIGMSEAAIIADRLVEIRNEAGPVPCPMASVTNRPELEVAPSLPPPIETIAAVQRQRFPQKSNDRSFAAGLCHNHIQRGFDAISCSDRYCTWEWSRVAASIRPRRPAGNANGDRE